MPRYRRASTSLALLAALGAPALAGCLGSGSTAGAAGGGTASVVTGAGTASAVAQGGLSRDQIAALPGEVAPLPVTLDAAGAGS